jgi:hypothetical protein
MGFEVRIGRLLFAGAMIAFGVQGLMFSKFIDGLEPGLSAWIAPMPWAWVNGGLMVVAGLSLLMDRTARVGALLLAAAFVLATVVLQGPLLAASLKNAADDLFHVLGVGAGALALAASVGRAGWAGRAGLAARVLFGLCTIGHGVMHFVFFKFTADFIPGRRRLGDSVGGAGAVGGGADRGDVRELVSAGAHPAGDGAADQHLGMDQPRDRSRAQRQRPAGGGPVYPGG